MAINVFLVFYFRTSPDSFRRWWWVYCIICYGGPFIIALSLLFVRKKGKGPVYGGATVSVLLDCSKCKNINHRTKRSGTDLLS